MINGIGGTFGFGRWFLGILANIGQNVYGGTYSAPLFLGMLSLVFIAIMAVLCVDILEIKSIMSAVFTGVIMAVFPAVTSIFAFMFTSAAYFMGGALNVLAVFVARKRINLWRMLASIFLIAIGLGIYQAFFAVAVTLCILRLITELLEEGGKNIIHKGCLYLLMLGGGLITYLCIARLVMKLTKESFTSYQGLDNIGKIDIVRIPGMLKTAYYQLFFELKWSGINNLLSMKLIVAILIVLVGLLVLIILCGNMIAKGDKIIMMALLLCLPIAINIVYLMSSAPNYFVHTLMRYSLCLSFLLPIVLMDRINEHGISKSMLNRTACFLMSILLWCISFHYIYNNNVAYLKENFLQEETIAYYTILVSQIRGTDGYQDGMPVAYIGEGHIEDMTLTKKSYFDKVMIDGYDNDLESMINDYAVRYYVSMHVGFSPNVVGSVDMEELMASVEVKQMPCYPDNGAIKVSDDILVVKLSD